MKQLFLLPLIFLMITSILQAEEKTVKIVSNHWQPYYDKELPHNGIVGELITNIFKRKGYSVKYLIASWSKALYEVKHLRYDCCCNSLLYR